MTKAAIDTDALQSEIDNLQANYGLAVHRLHKLFLEASHHRMTGLGEEFFYAQILEARAFLLQAYSLTSQGILEEKEGDPKS